MPAPTAPTLRRPPPWVEDERFTLNEYAWQDTTDPVRILAWLDDAGPDDDVRRKVGRAVLALVRAASPAPLSDALGRRAVVNLEAATVWANGGPYDEADVEALDDATTKVVKVLLDKVTDLPAAPTAEVARSERLVITDRVASARLPLLAFRASRGSLTDLVHHVTDGLRVVSFNLPPHRFAEAIRAEIPAPPAGYAEPRPPRRWNA